MILLMLGFIGWYASGYWLGQRLLRSDRFEGINEERRSRGIFLAVWILLWTGIIAGVIALLGVGVDRGACKLDGHSVVGQEVGHCIVKFEATGNDRSLNYWGQIIVLDENTDFSEVGPKAVDDRPDDVDVTTNETILVGDEVDLMDVFDVDGIMNRTTFLDSSSPLTFSEEQGIGFDKPHIIPQIIWMIVIYGSLFSLVLFAVRILRRRFTRQ